MTEFPLKELRELAELREEDIDEYQELMNNMKLVLKDLTENLEEVLFDE